MLMLGAGRARLDWLGADVWVEQGTWRDYLEVERFHYQKKQPAKNGRVWRLMAETSEGVEIAAVGIVGHCTLANRLRDDAFGLSWKRDDPQRHALLKDNLRVITRVIVDPRYRAAGLASALVRRLLQLAGTPAVEATARMGHCHPFFERAGMTRVGVHQRGGGVYYLWQSDSQGEEPEMSEGETNSTFWNRCKDDDEL